MQKNAQPIWCIRWTAMHKVVQDDIQNRGMNDWVFVRLKSTPQDELFKNWYKYFIVILAQGAYTLVVTQYLKIYFV